MYFTASEDGDTFSLHGTSYWSSGDAAWSAMVNAPGCDSSKRFIKTPFKARAPKSAVEVGGAGFLINTASSGISAGNFNNISVVVGTDGGVYLGPFTAKPADAALVVCVYAWAVSVAAYG